MSRNFNSIFLIFIGISLFLGCQKDPVAKPSTGNECDTINGRYSQTVFSAIDSLVDIEYGMAPTGENLQLDFYFPKGDTTSCKRPLVIFVHGGGFHEGNRKMFPARAICHDLPFKGYVTASISYRLAEDEPYNLEDLQQEKIDFDDPEIDVIHITNAMHDARAAVRYFKKNADLYNIDPDRIAIGGASAGGMTAINVGYMDKESELFTGAIPPNIEGDSGSPEFTSDVKVVYSLCSGFLNLEMLNGGNEPPLFFQQNSLDTIFIGNRLNQLRAKVDEVGLTHEILEQGGVHCLWGFPLLGIVDLIELRNELTAFLAENL